MRRCVCGCTSPAVQDHHAIYAQHVRRERGDVNDSRNLVPVALRCHAAHHDRTIPLPLVVLPDSVFEFAGELLGPAGYDYLRRRYRGDDPRVDALLAFGDDRHTAQTPVNASCEDEAA